METVVGDFLHEEGFLTASLMGSGINGNLMQVVLTHYVTLPLPLWEVELMETLYQVNELP